MNFEGNYYGESRPAKPLTKEEVLKLRISYKKLIGATNRNKLTGSNKVAPTKTKTKNK